MEAALQSILIALIMIVIPFLTGAFFSLFSNKEKSGTALTLVFGFLVMLTVFQLLVVPMMYTKTSFSTLKTTWFIIMIIISIISIIFHSKKIYKILHSFIVSLKSYPWYFFVAVGLIVLQAFVLSYYVHYDDDDAFFVATANTAIETDTILEYDAYTGELYRGFPMRYALSLFPVYCAVLSDLTSIHPAVFMHTVLPGFLIILSYITYYLIAKKLFKEKLSSIAVFMIFICVLNIFGNTSVYTTSSFLLLRIWQGKAVLANIIIPCIVLFAMKTFKDNTAWIDWFGLIMSICTACSVSSMGIAIAPITLGLFAVIYSIKQKSLRKFFRYIACSSPALIYGSIYIIARS